MAHGQDIRLYIEKSHELVKHIKCENGLIININIIFLNKKLLDIQKEILTDFLVSFKDKSGHDDGLSSEDVAHILEKELEEVNIKLQAFTQKIENLEDQFMIKGGIQVFYQGTLFSSLIGDVSILIVRNNQTYYTASNDIVSNATIDTFSDFIEGEISEKDKIVLLGTNYKNFLDKSDMTELNEIRIFDSKDIIAFFEKLFTSKIEATELCFILVQTFEEEQEEKVGFLKRLQSKLPKSKRTEKKGSSKILGKLQLPTTIFDQKFLIKHKYNITIAILGIFILFLAINVISTIRGGGGTQPSYVLEDGTEVTITIDGIKKDINDFANLDATDPKKASTYQKIIEQLGILESENRWPDEVKKRKDFVQQEYFEGFNIVLIDSITKNTNYFNNIYEFTSDQKATIGDAINILYNNQNLYVPGTKGAIIQAISQDIRGTTISYNDSSIDMSVCNLDLSKQGMYCADKNSSLYRITAGGVQPLYTDDAFFPGPIFDIGTFASSNLYVLHDDQSFEADNKKIISKYSNKIGSYTDFGNGTQYSTRFVAQGTDKQEFKDMAIDGTFLTWDTKAKKLYQLWREPESVNELSFREVALLGGDLLENGFSENVKIMQLADSPYVYFYDRDNKTLTIYSSNPSKTSSGKQQSYDLLYLFRMQFEKENNDIIDITIPENNSNFMYILTKDGIYESNLETFIRQFK